MTCRQRCDGTGIILLVSMKTVLLPKEVGSISPRPWSFENQYFRRFVLNGWLYYDVLGKTRRMTNVYIYGTYLYRKRRPRRRYDGPTVPFGHDTARSTVPWEDVWLSLRRFNVYQNPILHRRCPGVRRHISSRRIYFRQSPRLVADYWSPSANTFPAWTFAAL